MSTEIRGATSASYAAPLAPPASMKRATCTRDMPSIVFCTMEQQTVDQRNADFWDTLCGWNLAKVVGITGESDDDLERFDELYLGFYPYLEQYVPETFEGKKVLEVG